MNKILQNRLGGVGITPPTDRLRIDSKQNHFTYDSLNSSLKCSIDWFTCTFDKIEYKLNDGKVQVNDNSKDDLDCLFYFLTADKSYRLYDKTYGMNNYKEAIIIGEHIKVQLYGPRNSKGKNTTMIELSGSACSEFLARGGDFLELIKLMKEWGARCTRFDLAIDDFKGIVDIYELYYNYIDPCSFTSPFHDFTPLITKNHRTETYTGFGIYFGRRGSNQLLIYDKKLEREAKRQMVFDYEKWYRYEMRFSQGKATTIMNNFLVNLLKSQEDFNQFVYGCLYDLLDIKDKAYTNKNKSERPTAQFWLEFLNQVKKIKVVNEYKPEETIEKKEDWLQRSVDKTLAKLYLANDNFLIDRMNKIAEKMKYLKDNDLEQINKYLRKNNKKELSKLDVIKISKSISNY